MAENINIAIELEDASIINLELYPDLAPLSVKNFVEYINEKFFDGLCFHRIIPGFMIQGGGMVADGKNLVEKQGKRTVKGEFKSNGVNNPLKHAPGVISMARTMVKDSASSQFFICVGDTSFLDGEYAAFGKVSDEKSLLKAIEISGVNTTRVGYHDDVPVKPVVIKTIRII